MKQIYQLCLVLIILLGNLQILNAQCNKGITLSTQAEVDNFNTTYGCNRIEETLTISGDNINSLSNLNTITFVDKLVIKNNPLLQSLDGLENITEITYNFEIANNPLLVNIEIADISIGYLSSLKIYENNSLKNISINQLYGNLAIYDNLVLENINSNFANNEVSDVNLYNNPLLSNLNITANIIGTLRIDLNESLENIGNINANHIHFLNIKNNSNLSTCCLSREIIMHAALQKFENNATGCNSLQEITETCDIATYDCARDITLSTQTEVDNFGTTYGCEQIEGTLTISGNDINNLNGLNAITYVKSLVITNNPLLQNLDGLENVEEFELITIHNNVNLLTIAIDNTFLNGSKLEIFNNENLTDINISDLETLDGFIEIYNNNALKNLSIEVDPRGCFLRVYDNLALETLNFDFDDEYVYNAVIRNNTALTNINITGRTIGEELIIESNQSLENLNNINLEQIGELHISGNSNLSTCCLPAQILENTANLMFENNATGCNSLPEIVETCDIKTYDCTTDITLSTQAEVDNFSTICGGERIRATLTISGDDINNLNGLNAVNFIRTLVVKNNLVLNNITLNSVDFSSIKIFENQSLTTFVLNNSDVNGDLEIYNNVNLTNIEITELEISFNHLKIYDNNSLKNISIGAEPKGSEFSIYNNLVLENLNLNFINGYLNHLNLIDNPALTNVNAMGAYAKEVNIESNQSLETINNINIERINNLTVLNNPNLATCCLTLKVLQNGLELENNLSGCNSKKEIIEACENIKNFTFTDITLSTQAEVDNYSIDYGYESIGNTLTISGDDISNLISLNAITYVEDLVIENNPNLQSLQGLENLTDIGKNLIIDNNPLLQSLGGLENLESIGSERVGHSIEKEIIIKNNTNLLNIDAISVSNGYINRIIIENNNTLTQLPNFENSFEEIQIINNITLQNVELNSIRCHDGIYIFGNPSLNNISFQDIELFIGFLEIYDNSSLTDIQISNMSAADGFFKIYDNSSLTDIQISDMRVADGYLSVYDNNSLKNISIQVDPNRSPLDVDDNPSLHVSNNPSLENFNYFFGDDGAVESIGLIDNAVLANINIVGKRVWRGLAIRSNLNLESINNIAVQEIGNLTITENPNLSLCCLPSEIFQNLNELTIENNATGCSSLLEITETCTNVKSCVIEQSFTLSTQTQVDDFGACDVIYGDLTINSENSNEPVTDLSSLSGITRIVGSLSINNCLVENLDDLSNLTKIDSNLILNNLPALTNIDVLSNISRPDGCFLSGNLNALSSTSGLSHLAIIGVLSLSDLEISTSALNFSNLKYINEIYVINTNLTDLDFLSNISVGIEQIAIRKNADLQNIEGILNIRDVYASLIIDENESLSDCCLLPDWLMTLDGEDLTVEIINNADGCNSLSNIEASCNEVRPPNFEDFPWLNNIVDLNNCCNNQTVTQYTNGNYSYIYIEADSNCESAENSVYYKGQLFCDNEGDFCYGAYNLQNFDAITLWNCKGEPVECDANAGYIEAYNYDICEGRSWFEPAEVFEATENEAYDYLFLLTNLDGDILETSTEGQFAMQDAEGNYFAGGFYCVHGISYLASEGIDWSEGNVNQLTNQSGSSIEDGACIDVSDCENYRYWAKPVVNVINTTCNENETFTVELSVSSPTWSFFEVQYGPDRENWFRVDGNEIFTLTFNTNSPTHQLFFYDGSDARCETVYKVKTPGECSGNQPGFEDFPWLYDIVDLNNCCYNKTVTQYTNGAYSYIYIEADSSCENVENRLYYKGQLFCDGEGDLCFDNYKLQNFEAITLWNCEGKTGNNPNFEDFLWLNDLVDLNNCCNNQNVTQYIDGIHSYIYIEADSNCEDAENKVYYKGQLFCDNEGDFCYDAYRLQNFEAITLWNCGVNVVKKTSLEKQNSKNEKITNSTAINIYPNPAQGKLNIQTSGFNIENLQIEVADVTGKIVQTIKPKTNVLQLETSNLKAGNYLLFINDGSQSVVEKFIKID